MNWKESDTVSHVFCFLKKKCAGEDGGKAAHFCDDLRRTLSVPVLVTMKWRLFTGDFRRKNYREKNQWTGFFLSIVCCGVGGGGWGWG